VPFFPAARLSAARRREVAVFLRAGKADGHKVSARGREGEDRAQGEVDARGPSSTACERRRVDGVAREGGAGVGHAVGRELDVLKGGRRVVDAEVVVCERKPSSGLAARRREGREGRTRVLLVLALEVAQARDLLVELLLHLDKVVEQALLQLERARLDARLD